MADDPYQILGVPKGASDEDIRRAFRKLAKELHPDVTRGTDERFKKVSGAYDILGDPDKRKAFDRGEIDGRGEPRRDGYRQYARGARAGAGAGAGPGGAFDEFGFGDIFSEMFNGGRGGARGNFNAKGHDVRYTLDVDFLESALGATKRVTLPGGGTLDLNVPAGVGDGQVLRLKGKGIKSAGKPEAGDQLVTVRIVLPETIDDSLAYFFSEWRQKNRYDPGRK